MPLTTRERIGGRALLESLDTADLLSLAGTVTKKKSTACTRAGAIDTILQNSKSANELLSRKKVNCHVNAEYLKNEGVSIHPKISKADLIQKTIAHWSGQDFSVPYVMTFTPSSSKQQKRASGHHFSLPFYLHTSEAPIHNPIEDASKTWNPGTPTMDLDEITTAVSHIHVRDHVTFPPTRTQEKVSISTDGFSNAFPFNVSKMSISSCQKEDGKKQKWTSQPQNLQSGLYTTTRSILRPATFKAGNGKLVVAPHSGIMEVEDAPWTWPVNCEQFAKDFCEWFFLVLNSQQQSSRPQREDWGPQHFLENAELRLTYMSARRRYTGGTSSSSCLLALVQEERLFFQPNISSRDLKCERSPQGVMVVMVSGTIFRNKSYLGTFDQVFQVVGNSSTNNWKIQNIDLKIHISS